MNVRWLQPIRRQHHQVACQHCTVKAFSCTVPGVLSKAFRERKASSFAIIGWRQSPNPLQKVETKLSLKDPYFISRPRYQYTHL